MDDHRERIAASIAAASLIGQDNDPLAEARAEARFERLYES